MIFVSLISIVVGTPLMAILALKAKYVLLCIMIPIVGHGYYGFGFYLIAYRHNKTFIRLTELLNEGVSCVDELGERARLKEHGINYFLSKMERKGYLRDFVIEDGRISRK